MQLLEIAGEPLEELLTRKESGRSEFGDAAFSSGLHEMVLILLVRLQGYKLRAADLLELLGGDVALGARLVAKALRVTEYEAEAAAALSALLVDLTRPDAYFGAGAPAGGAEDAEADGSTSLASFTRRVDAVGSYVLSQPGTEVLGVVCGGLDERAVRASRRLQMAIRASVKQASGTSGAVRGASAASPLEDACAECSLLYAACGAASRLVRNLWEFAGVDVGGRVPGHIALACGPYVHLIAAQARRGCLESAVLRKIALGELGPARLSG